MSDRELLLDGASIEHIRKAGVCETLSEVHPAALVRALATEVVTLRRARLSEPEDVVTVPRIPDWKNARSMDQPHFAFWMSALTSEGLHAKADIARLLAMLTQELDAAQNKG